MAASGSLIELRNSRALAAGRQLQAAVRSMMAENSGLPALNRRQRRAEGGRRVQSAQIDPNASNVRTAAKRREAGDAIADRARRNRRASALR